MNTVTTIMNAIKPRTFTPVQFLSIGVFSLGDAISIVYYFYVYNTEFRMGGKDLVNPWAFWLKVIS